MDEAFGWSLNYQDLPAVTARVETRFHKPIAVGTKLIVKAWIVRQRRRLFDAHAEIRTDDPENTLLAEADAVMCLIEKADAEKTTQPCCADVSA
jgi:acyl-CoA thioesterase FadM